MFKVWTEKNHDHIINYPKVNKELSLENHDTMVNEWVDDIVDDFEAFKEGLYPDYVKEELEGFKALNKGSYDFDCGDFTYYIEID